MLKVGFLCMVLSVLIVPLSLSAFRDVDLDARTAGLAGGSSFIDGGISAATGNIASLGFAERLDLSFTHSSMFADLVTADFGGLAVPLGKYVSLGIWGTILGDTSDVYAEKTASLGCAFKPNARISVGLAAKMLIIGYDSNLDTVAGNDYFADHSASSFSADLGIVARPADDLLVGVAVQNVVPADLSISADEEDKVPAIVRVSLSYRFSSISGNVRQKNIGEILSRSHGVMEFVRRAGDLSVKMGVESWLSNMLAARIGYAHFAGDPENSSIFSGGIGLKIDFGGMSLRFDYAYQSIIGDLVDNKCHRVSSSLAF